MKIQKELTSFIPLIICLLALRWTVVEPYVVPTGSMEPTLKPGDRLYALKCAYDVRFPFTDWILFKTGKVKRGDVILFRAPKTPEITYVKRALGIPGDTIEFRSGDLYVNGKLASRIVAPDRTVMEDLERESQRSLYIEKLGDLPHYMILDNYYGLHRDFGPITIPEGHYLAVGDNRDNSHDSRAWGFVPEENLKGKAMFIWYSSQRVSEPQPADGFATHLTAIWDNVVHARSERVGTVIQ